MNIFSKNLIALKKILLFKPPENPPPFILSEQEVTQPAQSSTHLSITLVKLEDSLRYAKRLLKALAKT